MGKLHKRGDVWYADFVDRDGKRQQKSTRTGDKEVARARLRDLELGTTGAASDKTEDVAKAVDYFVTVACAAKPAGTVRCYRQKGGHIIRVLGQVQLSKLGREAVERYIAERLKEGAHTHSVHKELVVIRGMLASAKARGLATVPEAVPRFSAGYVPRTTHLTPAQFELLANNLLRPLGPDATNESRDLWFDRRSNRTLYCLLIALASPRRGELEAMTWDRHIDFANNRIRIPKGKTYGRIVKMHPQLREWLLICRKVRGPVVTPWLKVSRDLPRISGRLGIPKVTPNDLRRTFASWLIQGGESAMVVSRLLGHKSTRMVDLVYGQLNEEALSAAVDKLPTWSHAGVTDTWANMATPGAAGTTIAQAAIVNSVESSRTSTEKRVPKDGVEPPTRGFSVRSPRGLPRPITRQERSRSFVTAKRARR